MKTRIIPAIITLIILYAVPAISVTILIPDDYLTIQEGIDVAVEGDLILVSPGTYVEQIFMLDNGITLRSDEGGDIAPETTVIVPAGSPNSAVVHIYSGTIVPSTLQGFTIRNHTQYSGIRTDDASPVISDCIVTGNGSPGGIYCEGGAPTITNCDVYGNLASGGINLFLADALVTGCTVTGNAGGGIKSGGASPTIQDCTISGNTVEGNGGGIACFSGTVSITNCTITENVAAGGTWTNDGAGVWISSSNVTLSNSVITNNHSDNLGGGIYCEGASPVISDCLISDNEAGSSGGLHIRESSPTIERCTISNNLSHGGAGGIQFWCSPSSTLINCMITGNTATTYAGGVYCCSSSPTITHCTISDNDGGSDGGGIKTTSGTFPTVVNSIVWGNQPDQISNDGDIDVTYTDVQDGWPGDGNIDADPLFASGADYHITWGSPCIDAGIDAGVVDDIDGEGRPQGVGFDMGADEIEEEPPCWDIDGDGFEDEVCGGDDCDDSDPDVNPGADEICTGGVDEDCDGLVDDEDPDCIAPFTLALEASYGAGILSLNFTIGTPQPATWANFLISTHAGIQVIPLWIAPLSVIEPPIQLPIAFPLPDMGWIGFLTALYTEEGQQAMDFTWVDTG